MLENRNPRYDLFAVVLLVFVLFLAASLLSYDPADPVPTSFPPLDRFYQPDQLVWPQNDSPSNAFGYLGAIVADVLLTTLGCGAYFLAIGLGAVAFSLLQRQSVQSLWTKTFGWLLTLAGMTTLATMLFPLATPGPVIGPGGYLGALGNGLLTLYFARTGAFIIAASVLAIGFFMWTEYVGVRIAKFALESIMAVIALLVPIKLLAGLRDRASESRSKRPSSRKRPKFVRDDLAHSDRAVEEDEFEEIDDVDEVDYEDPLDETESDDEGYDGAVEDHEELEVDESFEDELDDAGEANPPVTIPFITKKAAKTAPATEPLKKGPKPGVHSQPHFDHQPAQVESPKRTERDEVIERLNQAALTDEAQDYELPEIQLLKSAKKVSGRQVKVQTTRRGKILEKTFEEFGHRVRVVDVETGPVITQYELQLEAGLRLAKITNLADDIAIALRVPSVRIVAPIPGKNTVGIEVPNETRQMVRLREVMEESANKTRKMKIPLFLGKDVAGDTIIADLATLPHLLIAGRTGTGKSVCLNAIISSILMTRRPDEVRMLMIDPKMVELSGYGRLPHLMHPVVTDMRKAEAILAWAVDKMEERYKLLARAGVRHISSYNQLGAEELYDRLQPENDEEREAIPVNLPFIVIVADEMADLMMTAGKEVEQHIIRLAQKSRAVGIHLILATQKPTVDVITGLIKSNLPARISFQVASRTDSRVVLDEMGAEKLLGNGDMLFLWPGTSTLLRGQGTYLSDDEIDAVTDSVSTGEQNFVNELVNMKIEDPQNDSPTSFSNRDELYHDAVDVVIRENRGSVSLLQRALGIGYGRAARLIDFMEEDGVVGPYNGSKSREIIMTADQWSRIKAGDSADEQAEPDAEPSAPAAPSIPRIEKRSPGKAKPGKRSKRPAARPPSASGDADSFAAVKDDDMDPSFSIAVDESEAQPEFETVIDGELESDDDWSEDSDSIDVEEDEDESADEQWEYELYGGDGDEEEVDEEVDEDFEEDFEENDEEPVISNDASDNWISDDDEVAEDELADDEDELDDDEESEEEWEYEAEGDAGEWEYEEDGYEEDEYEEDENEDDDEEEEYE